jgi:DNA-binding NtrC family response regulator
MSAPEPAILIVDDEGAIVEVLQRALQRQGYNAQAVKNAPQALDLLASTSFDLILCDLALPGMKGVAFYQQLISSKPGMTGRFILMTGEMLNPSDRSFAQDNHIPVLMKPFDLAELYAAVEKALQVP